MLAGLLGPAFGSQAASLFFEQGGPFGGRDGSGGFWQNRFNLHRIYFTRFEQGPLEKFPGIVRHPHAKSRSRGFVPAFRNQASKKGAGDPLSRLSRATDAICDPKLPDSAPREKQPRESRERRFGA